MLIDGELPAPLVYCTTRLGWDVVISEVLFQGTRISYLSPLLRVPFLCQSTLTSVLSFDAMIWNSSPPVLLGVGLVINSLPQKLTGGICSTRWLHGSVLAGTIVQSSPENTATGLDDVTTVPLRSLSPWTWNTSRSFRVVLIRSPLDKYLSP